MADPATAKAQAFVDDLDHPRLRPADWHHLERVLRVRPGDGITVSDGFGGRRPCVFHSSTRDEQVLDTTGPVTRDPAPTPALTIGFALVKGERPELVVQKLTELGADRVIPFAAARSVVRWDDAKAARQHERLVIVAREAAMQSRRTWLPVVEPLATFIEVSRLPGAALAQQGGAPPSLAHPVLLVGPEGGWSADELACGLPQVDLGPNVLRAETAAIAAIAIGVALRAGVVAARAHAE
jgi:16S rRNA (uracil1498-N3)-methyltransferase